MCFCRLLVQESDENEADQYTEDFTVLVVVSETAGLFDDVISAY